MDGQDITELLQLYVHILMQYISYLTNYIERICLHFLFSFEAAYIQLGLWSETVNQINWISFVFFPFLPFFLSKKRNEINHIKLVRFLFFIFFMCG